MSPGEQTRDYYRNQGRQAEAMRWLEAIAACREALNELTISRADDPITHKLISVANETLDNVERLTK